MSRTWCVKRREHCPSLTIRLPGRLAAKTPAFQAHNTRQHPTYLIFQLNFARSFQACAAWLCHSVRVAKRASSVTPL